MKKYSLPALLLVLASLCGHAQQYDSIVGDAVELGEPTEHWFAVRGRNIAWISFSS